MNILELKITLRYVEPEVERVFLVPSFTSLDDLHDLIQAAMPWDNYHLHVFSCGDVTWSRPDPEWGTDDLPSDETTIQDIVTKFRRRRLKYIYDFGDGWEHLIKIGRKRKHVAGELYPQLIGVTGKCPPEDVGGPYGYSRFLEVISNPDHEEHEGMIEWCGEEFDPDKPETEELKATVRRIATAWAKYYEKLSREK